MRELENKQKIKRRMYSTPMLVVLSLITLVLARGAVSVMLKKAESVRHVEELNKQATDLEDRQARLEADISRLGTEAGIDEEIKKKFSVSKEGEHVAIIVDARTAASSTDVKENSLFEDWWNTIKSLWQ